MTEVDELLLTAAKLAEQARGDLDAGVRLRPHAGAVSDHGDRAALSFLSDADTGWLSSSLRKTAEPTLLTEEATTSVIDGRTTQLSNIVGVTEQELDASALTLSVRLLEELENNGAPAFVLGCGLPNTGKTTLVATLAELRKAALEELLVVSNVRSWSFSDRTVASAHDLAVTLLKERDRPKFVFVDEGSTHFDARTSSREVATQWTPLAKRMAKIGVDTCATVGHTGKDVHPEYKRMTTLAFYKEEPTTAEFFDGWDSEEEEPDGRLFGGTLDALEEATTAPDPDDAAPWAWNLREELFAKDLNWSQLLEELRARGPAE